MHSQLLFAQLLQPQPPEASEAPEVCAAAAAAAAAAADVATPGGRSAAPGQFALYPSLHLGSNWGEAEDRRRGVFVPDVSPERLARVERDSNVSLVVGSFPAAFEGGSTQAVELLGRGFDAVATAFFVDVMHDLPAALATLRSLLVPSRGLWLNLGPLVTGRPSNQGDPPIASAG